jgi:hypothetical protein
MKYLTLTIAITFLSLNLSAAHHEEPKGIGGLISSDVFDLAGEMDLHVEKYQSCGDSANQKHYHPVGTLVYVINGKGASNASGEWKTYTDGSYWFEPSMWKHGGIDPNEPKFGDDQCTENLVIRVSRKGEEPTVFVE